MEDHHHRQRKLLTRMLLVSSLLTKEHQGKLPMCKLFSRSIELPKLIILWYLLQWLIKNCTHLVILLNYCPLSSTILPPSSELPPTLSCSSPQSFNTNVYSTRLSSQHHYLLKPTQPPPLLSDLRKKPITEIALPFLPNPSPIFPYLTQQLFCQIHLLSQFSSLTIVLAYLIIPFFIPPPCHLYPPFSNPKTLNYPLFTWPLKSQPLTILPSCLILNTVLQKFIFHRKP